MNLLVDATISDSDFRRLSEAVYRHCGIDLHDGKRSLVQSRLGRCLRACHYTTVTEYLDAVLAKPGSDEFQSLIDSISTNLTSFFREASHFDYIRSKFLPELFHRHSNRGGHRIRAWSAACSSGEEPYSLAATVLDVLEKQPVKWDFKLLATDISRPVLQRAKAGAYSAAAIGSIPPDLRRFFSVRKGAAEAMEAGPALRQVIRFAHLNLMGEWPFDGPFDFIFCRNVMIYFDKPTQERLVNRFWTLLQPGGLLFTGHSESLSGVAHQFKYVQPTVYLRG